MLEIPTTSLDEPSIQICPAEGDRYCPKIASGDGYSNESERFVKAVHGESVPEFITPPQSVDALRLVLAETQSAASGDKVSL